MFYRHVTWDLLMRAQGVALLLSLLLFHLISSLARGHPTSHDSTRSKHTIAGCCCCRLVPDFLPSAGDLALPDAHVTNHLVSLSRVPGPGRGGWRGAFAGARSARARARTSPHAVHGHARARSVDVGAAPRRASQAKANRVFVARRRARTARKAYGIHTNRRTSPFTRSLAAVAAVPFGRSL